MMVSPTRFWIVSSWADVLQISLHSKHCGSRNLASWTCYPVFKDRALLPCVHRLPDCAFYNRPQTTQFPGASLRVPLSPSSRGALCTPQRYGVKQVSDAFPRPRFARFSRFRAKPRSGRALGVPL